MRFFNRYFKTEPWAPIHFDISEAEVSSQLHQLDLNKYLVIDNVMLPSTGKLTDTQIDHIVISAYGIFCIETKGYGGWILGNANNKYWTHVFYDKKFKFLNPFRQNFAHIKAIENLLGNPRQPIVSLIAFPRADKILVKDCDLVGDIDKIIEIIKSYKKPIYSIHERTIFYEALKAANITDKEAIKNHINEVKALATAR